MEKWFIGMSYGGKPQLFGFDGYKSMEQVIKESGYDLISQLFNSAEEARGSCFLDIDG